MSRIKPCHRILKRRTKTVIYNNKLLELTEPSAQDYDSFLELVKNADLSDARELELNDRKLFNLICGWITYGELPESIDMDFANILVPTIAELAESDVIYSNSKEKAQTPDPIDAPDAYIFRMIDTVAHHYGINPMDVYEQYSYRQINYLFVMAYNHIVYKNYAGGKKPPEVLNAKGLMIDTKTLPTNEKMAYFGRLRIQEKERQNNG